MGAPTYGFLWEGLECMVENGVVGATTHNIVNVAPLGRVFMGRGATPSHK